MHAQRILTLVAAAAIATGCASSGSAPAPATTPAPGSSSTQPATVSWPIRTAEYVDLWFHGYALVTNDTAKVPLFERGYRTRMNGLRGQRNVTTALDANRATLEQGLAQNPGLVNGQFVIFNFASLEELARVTQQFVRNDGSPGTVSDQTTQQLFLALRSAFRTVNEREWLRLFVQSLQDEDARFYKSYWTAQQTDRAAARTALESAWTTTYRAKFQRYLRNERLADGTFILSLPLGGEGRGVFNQGLGNGIAVNFPTRSDSAMNALYTFAHEIVGGAAGRAIEDNLTPADRRDGAEAKYTPIAAVRGGAILLSKIAPELVAGYQRFYLSVIGMANPAGDPAAAFNSAFGLPDAVVRGLERQIDLVLAGI